MRDAWIMRLRMSAPKSSTPNQCCRLGRLGTFDTGGRGTGKPHLASQSSIVLNRDGTLLLVTNAGSDEISLFTVEPDGLLLVAQAPSGGSTPTS